MKRVVSALALYMMLLSHVSLAAAKAAPEKPKVTVYEFDNDKVEGELFRPQGDMVTGLRRNGHPSLIKLRLSFLPEMIRASMNL